jgi:Co/Zn/Cd efflux system component
MVQTRSVVAGVTLGLLIVAAGLFFIFGKDALWAMTEAFYNLFGIQSTRTQGWAFLTSAIGVVITLFGAFLIWAVLMVRKNAKT